MKFKAISTLITGLITFSPITAIAAKGYIGTDGYLYITELEPSTQYKVKFGGMPVVRAGGANSCGVLRIRASAIYKDSDRFEITDEGSNKKYAIEYDKLAVGDKPVRCNGEVITQNKAWRSQDGRTIFVTGLTPNRGQTISILSQNLVRRLTTNFCGYFRFKLDGKIPDAIIVGGEAFPTNTSATGRGMACRYAEKYVSLPPPPEISKEPEQQWEENNPVPFSEGSTTIDSTGTTGSTGNNSSFQLPQPEPSFYLVNGALVVANRPDNGEILATFQIDSVDYEKLSLYGRPGSATCGRTKVGNQNSFSESYTTKKNIRVDFWGESYMNLGNYGWKYVTIPKGTILQNFPYGYTSCDS